MESPRDARRRRIMKRGNDRLAFITGESRSLPSKQEDELESDPYTTTGEIASFGENDTTVIEAAKQWEKKEDEANQRIVDTGDITEKSEPTNQATKPHLNDEIMKHGIKNDTPTVYATNSSSLNMSNVSNDKEVHTSSMAHSQPDQRLSGPAPSIAHSKNHLIFSSSQISQSISASENIRLLSAVAIAFLVILSNHQYNISGGLLRGMICSRPLLLVLLTDATIVLGRSMSIKGNDQKVEKTRARNNDNELADNIGRTLEVGLVVQKAMKSVFMDCIICAVIMICGLRV